MGYACSCPTFPSCPTAYPELLLFLPPSSASFYVSLKFWEHHSNHMIYVKAILVKERTGFTVPGFLIHCDWADKPEVGWQKKRTLRVFSSTWNAIFCLLKLAGHYMYYFCKAQFSIFTSLGSFQ